MLYLVKLDIYGDPEAEAAKYLNGKDIYWFLVQSSLPRGKEKRF